MQEIQRKSPMAVFLILHASYAVPAYPFSSSYLPLPTPLFLSCFFLPLLFHDA